MIVKIFLMSLFCVGIFRASQPDMILEPVRNFIYKFVKSEYFRNPLFSCPYCMASVWGTIAYTLLLGMGYGFNAVELLFCCVCCVPLNGLLNNILDKTSE